jgi:conjugal transfer mating pair stabilization protein TraG
MNWEILVLGDGAYVNAVLNAVSSINSYGMLGALGAMIGLLVMGFSGMAGKNGPSIEPVWIFLSVVVFSIMFLPRVDRVVIVELMVQPGGVGPRTFVVDNVPFGLAAVGYTVSRLGNGVSGIYDTSFGSAADEERARTGGLGSNLQRIGWIRTMLNDPGFTDRSGNLARHRANLINYIHACTLQGVNQNRITAASVYYRQGYEGLAYQTEARYIEYTDRNGNVTQPSCREAFDLLNAYVDTHLRADFDRALSDRFPADQSPPSSTEIVRAFAEFGYDVSNNIQIMLASQLVNAVAHQAAATGPLSTMEVAQTIMIEEAAARRASQMSAEETLFVRILRPTVSFFEALFYALAPIMAFLVATGQFGWKLTSKYLALTIWVILWFPMMAVIQLYSNVKFDYFMRRLGSDELLTPAGVHALSMEAIEHLTAAAALTAATPALAMSLIYGGAVSMSYLAGRLQGGDMTDEGLTGGKAMTQAPLLQQMAHTSNSIAGGATEVGGTVPTISVGEARENSMALSRQASSSAEQAFARSLQNEIATGASVKFSGGATDSTTSSSNFDAAWGRAIDQGIATNTITADQAATLRSLSESQRLAVYTDASVTASTPGAAISPVSMRATAGLRGELGMDLSDSQSQSTQSVLAMARHLSQSESARSGLTESVAHGLASSHGYEGSTTDSSKVSESLAMSARDVITATQTASESASLGSRSGVEQRIDFNTMGQRVGAQGIAEMKSQYLYGHPERMEYFESRLAHYSNSSNLRDEQSQNAAALHDTLANQRLAASGDAVGQAQGYAELIRRGSDLGTEIDPRGIAPQMGGHSALMGEAPSGRVTSHSEADLAAPRMTSGQVQGRADQMIGMAEGQTAGSQLHLDNQRDNFATETELAGRESEVVTQGREDQQATLDATAVSELTRGAGALNDALSSDRDSKPGETMGENRQGRFSRR